MSKKSTRKTRQRRRRTPDWVILYRDRGEVPEYGTEEYGELVGWMYMQEAIPGLPVPESPEALALQRAARPALDAECERISRVGINPNGRARAREVESEPPARRSRQGGPEGASGAQ